MKIYLAGKVSKNGWRTRLVRGANLNGMDLDAHESQWPVLERAIFGEHDFVGPFLYGCDHGCFHGDGQHGMIFEEDGACCVEKFFIDRKEIVRRCLEAVRRADLVFCWLEAPEDYGSMVEVGYALALGKQVAIAVESPPMARLFHRWAALVDRVEAEDPPLWGIVVGAQPLAWTAAGLTLAFATDSEAALARASLDRIARATGAAAVAVETDVRGEKFLNDPPNASTAMLNSHWFAVVGSSFQTVIGDTPDEALRAVLGRAQKCQRDPLDDLLDLENLKIKPSERRFAPTVQYGIPVEAWNLCGSPIEKALLYGIITAAARAGIIVELKLNGKETTLVACAGSLLTIRPQHKVCNHRTDFMIEYRDVRAVVECDGHDYHERTKEQAQHDRELDRAFQREGFRVFRFTGREIWQSPEECAASMIRDLQAVGG